MNDHDRPRLPAGQPTGGQFAEKPMHGSGILLEQTECDHFDVTASNEGGTGPDVMTCADCGLSWEDPTWTGDDDVSEIELLRDQVDQAREDGSAGRLSELADIALDHYGALNPDAEEWKAYADQIHQAREDGSAGRLSELTDNLLDDIEYFESLNNAPAPAEEKLFNAKAGFEAEFGEGSHEIMAHLIEGKDDIVSKARTIPPGDDRPVTREWLVDTLNEAGLQSPHFGADVTGSVEDFEVSMYATNGVRQTVFIEAGTPTERIPPFLVTMAEELDVDERFGDATGRFNPDSENIWRRYRSQEKFLNPQRIESNRRAAQESP